MQKGKVSCSPGVGGPLEAPWRGSVLLRMVESHPPRHWEAAGSWPALKTHSQTRICLETKQAAALWAGAASSRWGWQGWEMSWGRGHCWGHEGQHKVTPNLPVLGLKPQAPEPFLLHLEEGLCVCVLMGLAALWFF